MTLLALFGGLALLLYGMQLIGEGLQRAAGGHLRHLLTRMTRTRLAAVASGALVTSIIQSSSATTLMLIGFVSAGLLTFPQSLGVILGADIGTTVTVQLLAFKVQELSLLLVGVGFAMAFFGRRGLIKSAGQVVLGFGFIFLGMKVMNDGLAPLAAQELTRQVLVALAGNPFLGLLVGAGLSAAPTRMARNWLSARAISTWRVSGWPARGARPSLITFMPRKMKPKPSTTCPRLLTRPRRPKNAKAKPTPTSSSDSSCTRN
ncbi:MAG TPA: Na/Pi symporter, partial [Methylomirabilota bacterium]